MGLFSFLFGKSSDSDVDTIKASFDKYSKIEQKVRNKVVRNENYKKIGKKVGEMLFKGAIGSITGGEMGAVSSAASSLLSSDDDNNNDMERQIKAEIYTEKFEFIDQFPIPTSKEGFLEFLSNAVPLAIPDKNIDTQISKLWMKKCKIVIKNAKFFLKNDPKTLSEVMYYASILNKYRRMYNLRIGILVACIVLIIWILCVFT